MNWQSTLYFLGWAALFSITMRLGCGAHVMGYKRHLTQGPAADRAPDAGSAGQHSGIVRDPVCGMQVTVATAKSSIYQNRTHYFCSSACREKFEAAPATYSSTSGAVRPDQEHGHGCC